MESSPQSTRTNEYSTAIANRSTSEVGALNIIRVATGNDIPKELRQPHLTYFHQSNQCVVQTVKRNKWMPGDILRPI